MRKTLALAAALACWSALPVAAANAEVERGYDLLFRQGTLDDLARDAVLHYTRNVTNRASPDAALRDSGFPASVGNPMIMYFYESVVRDMAETAGGSPFYIRNRVKDALVRPAEILEGEAEFQGRRVATRTIVLRPFADDPNRARMRGFGDLELRVTMSEAVPGWYLSLVAEAPDAAGSPAAYLSELRLDGVSTQ
jgi:hypothetical protein